MKLTKRKTKTKLLATLVLAIIFTITCADTSTNNPSPPSPPSPPAAKTNYCGDATIKTPVNLYNKVANTPLTLDPLIASGSGTEADPYVVPIEAGCEDFTFVFDPSPTGQEGGLTPSDPGRVYFTFDLLESGYKFDAYNAESITEEEEFDWALMIDLFELELPVLDDDGAGQYIDPPVSNTYLSNQKITMYFLTTQSTTPTFVSQKGWRVQKVNCEDTSVTCGMDHLEE